MLDSALGRRLAERIESFDASDAWHCRRALVDGYALAAPHPAGAGAGLAAPAHEIPTGVVEVKPGLAVRVDRGAPLGESVACVVSAAETVLVGSDALRIEAHVSEGDGIASRDFRRASFERGVLVGPRLRALAAASGRTELEVYDRPRVAFATVGDELRRAAPTLGGDAGSNRVFDLTGSWGPLAMEAAGAEPVSLGILPDDPRELRRAILHCRTRRIDAIVIAGGLGDGVHDRTREGLHEFECRLRFERVALAGCESLVYGTALGMEVLAIPGSPGAAAASWDLFVRPFVLARAGAPASLWDWSLDRDETGASALPPPARPAAWFLQAVVEGGAGSLTVQSPNALGIEPVRAWLLSLRPLPPGPWKPGAEQLGALAIPASP